MTFVDAARTAEMQQQFARQADD